jgi:hypothetical protein
MACSCAKGSKAPWKAYDKAGKLIGTFTADTAGEIKAKAAASKAGGFAKQS